jgi:hypothetical protein
MPEFTAEEIEKEAGEILLAIGPKLELNDLVVVAPKIMELVETVSDMTNTDKHKTALNLLTYVLDHTDTPWLPDAVSDPLFLKLADMVLIPLIAKASKGEFNINKDSSE